MKATDLKKAAASSEAASPPPGRHHRRSGRLRNMAQLAAVTAIMVAWKETMNFLPNIHPVTLLLILCVKVYGAGAFYPAFAFALIEIAIYGLGMWSSTYLYIWPLITAAALLFRKTDSRLFWALFAGISGLCFGILTALQTFVLFGFKSGVAYWVAGIGYDIVHCVSNFIIVFFLYEPLLKLMKKLRKE